MNLRPNTLRLIQNGHHFRPFYQGGLSNHLPMAVAVLDGLGASEEHDVKLVFTCRREFDFYGDDAYRKTANAYMSSR